MYIKYVFVEPLTARPIDGQRREHMPISSLVIRTGPTATENVCEELASCPLIEIAHVQVGAIAAVTETPDDQTDQQLWKLIEGLHGVTHVELIYHNFEDLEGPSHVAE